MVACDVARSVGTITACTTAIILKRPKSRGVASGHTTPLAAQQHSCEDTPDDGPAMIS